MYEHVGEGGDVVGVRANAGGENGAVEKVDLGCAQKGLRRGKREVVLVKTLEKFAIFSDW